MPVVDVDPDELRRLTGHDEKSDEQLKADLFALGLEYEGETEDGEFQLEFAPDRLDRLSVEGVARSLRYQYGDDRGVYIPKTNDAEWVIEVDEAVPDERPYVTGAIVRGLDMTAAGLESLIQVQEKLHATMGRKRAKGAIGVHDLAMLKGREARSASVGASGAEQADDPGARTAGANRPKTITYTGVEADGDTFVPLDANEEMTPGRVLTDHPTGEKFADLVADYERYPAIYDDVGLFSFPPVINGTRTEVDEDSRDLFVEMTGTDQWTIDKMLNVVCYALDARGGRVEEVRVAYPDREVLRPDLSTSRKTVAHERIESVLGVDLSGETIVDLLERAGLDAEREARSVRKSRSDLRSPSETRNVSEDASNVPSGEHRDPRGEETGDDGPASGASGTPSDESDGTVVYDVAVPPYRVDVLHPLDVVDDVGRAYGFNDLEPRYPDVSTVGGRHDRSRLERAVREMLVGLGFEDLLNFHMISVPENYDRLGVSPGDDCVGGGEPVTITEPYSEDYAMLRTWALPSLLSVLENNTHRAYPQDLAEIGLAAERDDDEPTHVAERRTVAGVLARTDASYEDAKTRLQAIARAFGTDLETPATEHPTFVQGRAAAIRLDGEAAGVVGEVHPEVLVEHDLELPVAAFEFDLGGLA